MTGKRQRAPRSSAWQKHAEEITQRRVNGDPHVLTLTALSEAAGLTTSTVMSYVNRTGTTVKGAVAHLARPAYRVGAATPHWSQEQLDRYFEAKAEESQLRAEQVAGLPEVSRAEAERRKWWTLRRLAAWAGFAPVTFYRIANEEGFPPPVAVAKSDGPNPLKLRDRAAVGRFLRASRPDWKPSAVQDAQK